MRPRKTTTEFVVILQRSYGPCTEFETPSLKQAKAIASYYCKHGVRAFVKASNKKRVVS